MTSFSAMALVKRGLAAVLSARYYPTYQRYAELTMVPGPAYVRNLMLASRFRDIDGAVVECGVWRGGMIAGIADLLGPDRDYHLFDSFEGLPPATEIDGESAIAWQSNKDGPLYCDNCRAEEAWAQEAMRRSRARRYRIHKGWFTDTLSGYDGGTIAILRLDGDWYDSTIQCLEALYPKVSSGGVIIVDDYYVWDGCSRAVHAYLARIGSVSRVWQFLDSVCYIVKRD